ncbi:hypothetical protein EW146_g9808 [Bondarzewia mesenterica]|uniref:Uncharacterized protein n=1 Tax=Bondarzewia mesenterica TaxID=1095465 RepID=A0A4S4L811_9AGAM|nr:hypothetical protein EW146_g9808 [Bondarzewia mesenterica]
MASGAYYFGPVGLTGGRSEDPLKPRMHTYDAFLAVDDSDQRDIDAQVHAFMPSSDAVPEDGTYFISARIGLSAIDASDSNVADDDSRGDVESAVSRVQKMEFFVSDVRICFNRAFLSPLHTFVDDFNFLALNAHPNDEQLYYSSDALQEADSTDVPELLLDYFTQLKHPAVPAHELALKVGTICTIERNLAVDKKLVHNARVEVVNLRQRSVDVRVIGDTEVHSLPRILFAFNPPYSSWTVTQRQFPLRVAYATTFNSCLGLTLDRIVVDIHMCVFAHGQLYTALSRVRKQADVLLLTTDDYDEYATHVVYKELLL